MKISISYQLDEWRVSIEPDVERHTAKIEKLLKSYSPDLVQLHGRIESKPRKKVYLFSLNVSLPTGALNATGEGSSVRACVKTGFGEIETQIKKHMALLRKDYEWKRKRPRVGLKSLTVT